MKIPKIKKLPSGNYNCYLRLGGENISITAPTERECRLKAQQVKSEYLAAGGPKTARGTVLALARVYIAERQNICSPSTINGYNTIVDRYPQLHNLTPNQVSWQREANAAAKRWSAKTVHNDFGFWSSVLRSAGYQMPAIRLPQIVAKEHSWLTPEQIPVFLEAIKGKPKEIGALLALHGLRRSELLALEKGSVRDGHIYVQGAVVRGKNGYIKKPENKNPSSRRRVPVMIPRLQELVDAAPEGKLYRWKPNSLYDFVNKACQTANLPPVGVHGLRHSCVSLCVRLRLTERQIMDICGYSDPGTMRKIYTHICNKDREDAAKKLQTFYKKKGGAC